MPFQSAYKYQPGIGIPGAFASSNPRSTYVGDQGIGKNSVSPSGMVVCLNGVSVGSFVWVADSGNYSGIFGTVTNQANQTTLPPLKLLPPAGFVGLSSANATSANFEYNLSSYEQDGNLIIPGGSIVDIYTGGDFFCNLIDLAQVPDYIPSEGDPIFCGQSGTNPFPAPNGYTSFLVVQTQFVYVSGGVLSTGPSPSPWQGGLCIISAPAV